MQQFPFTDQGAAQLISALYALSNQDLQAEANAAGTDFQQWVAAHFELDEDQLDYLDHIDPLWIAAAAANTKYFLENRLPILLHKQQPPAGRLRGDSDGKLLDLDKKNSASYNSEDGTNESEVLNFGISYQEP